PAARDAPSAPPRARVTGRRLGGAPARRPRARRVDAPAPRRRVGAGATERAHVHRGGAEVRRLAPAPRGRLVLRPSRRERGQGAATPPRAPGAPVDARVAGEGRGDVAIAPGRTLHAARRRAADAVPRA